MYASRSAYQQGSQDTVKSKLTKTVAKLPSYKPNQKSILSFSSPVLLAL